jgi:hypothetical protein
MLLLDFDLNSVLRMIYAFFYHQSMLFGVTAPMQQRVNTHDNNPNNKSGAANDCSNAVLISQSHCPALTPASAR